MSAFVAGAPRRGRTLLALVAVALVSSASAHLANGCAPASKTHPAVRQVTIHAMRYEPEELSVAVGDTVEWVNRDLVPHTATAQSRDWDSGTIAPDASWRTIVREHGAFPYICLFHPGMRAELSVR